MTMTRTPIHPGEILRDELEEIGITGTELSRRLKVPENRIPQIVAGKRSITADTALRLGKWFGTTPAFWLNLQKSYELRKAARDIGKEIDTIPTRSREPV
jgi:addiction module HigA family antidote